jgi:hypothetical protein
MPATDEGDSSVMSSNLNEPGTGPVLARQVASTPARRALVSTRGRIAATAILCLVLGSLIGPTAAGAATETLKDVFVRNTTANPVPVTPVGSTVIEGTVNVGSLPAVRIDPNANTVTLDASSVGGSGTATLKDEPLAFEAMPASPFFTPQELTTNVDVSAFKDLTLYVSAGPNPCTSICPGFPRAIDVSVVAVAPSGRTFPVETFAVDGSTTVTRQFSTPATTLRLTLSRSPATCNITGGVPPTIACPALTGSYFLVGSGN